MQRMTHDLTSIATLATILPVPSRAVMNDDQEKLAARIERLIRRQTNDKVRELRVVVLAEGIILKGRCGTFYSKQLAQHAAMTLAHGASLVNHIDVW